VIDHAGALPVGFVAINDGGELVWAFASIQASRKTLHVSMAQSHRQSHLPVHEQFGRHLSISKLCKTF